MKQEDKQLLLQDLCARLPYNVLVLNKDGDVESFTWQELKEFEEDYIIKPYLRPMSSMTEEEKEKVELLCDGLDIDDEGNSFHYLTILKNRNSNQINTTIIDWLNKHHFDYRGLIEKDLALEAPEGMYE